jgi:hypothetical protein
VGAVPRSYQVTPVGPSHQMSAQRTDANPKAAVFARARHQVGRPNHRIAAPSTLTLNVCSRHACIFPNNVHARRNWLTSEHDVGRVPSVREIGSGTGVSAADTFVSGFCQGLGGLPVLVST